MRPLRGRGYGVATAEGSGNFGGDYNNVVSPLCIMLRRTVYRTFLDDLEGR